MSGLNLHRIVRGPIQVVNPDVPGDVYISTGHTTLRGIVTPTFQRLPAQRLQVQAVTTNDLYQLNGLGYAKDTQKLYAYGTLSGIVRPEGKGGDLVNLANTWWAIQGVIEWWPQWCSVAITRQVDAATLDALLTQLRNGNVV
ncbi:hypothetical protein [Xanthomonas phage pXoo2107]|uniref:Uncharacterized protein n=1 Tax=Xanthomonas phage XPV1 TaxID=2099860 RepID=A0A3S7I6E4_9CAUD|nr:head protein [Xanthomonas phage XPV1]AVO24226.1 hypothetical protein [Xanthomonas phage XPV1]AVO24250.1 hypothetical protein [Xanthomonas phage XPV2]AVO24386.1 hypothetical protein [Xanthomonas phage XPV3]UUR56284.1 hypothetical protein [Xanthomonas phage pXoo2107]